MSCCEERDVAYTERNRLVALVARLFPSGLRKTDIPDWDPEWHNCVWIDAPGFQMSWHYHDKDAYLFEGLPAYEKPWDGHTTEEKYVSLERLTKVIPLTPGCLRTIGRLRTMLWISTVLILILSYMTWR